MEPADILARDERRLLLQYVQPGLLGLMDGTVSTLAPLFATAFATGNTRTTLLVGLSAAIGAAISMGFAEALSDTGIHTERGHPLRRGAVTGLMTLFGGILHAVPFLLSDIHAALIAAYVVVGAELVAISYVRYHYFKMNFALSMMQIIVGGALVVLAGILIGSA
jgi:VIT1/CCC1 family predicted Fe2+/Mn2+ transporter